MSVFKPFKSSDMVISPLRVSKGFTYQGILPTYTLTSNKSSYDEGEKVIITLNTTYIPDNTILPFTMSGNEGFRNDIRLFPVNEEFKIINGVATFEFYITEDLTTEGEETINIALNNGGDSIDIVINDTSLTPIIYPIYTINSTSIVNEGETISVDITTSHPDLTAGTMVFLTHSGISSSDYATNLPAMVVLDNTGSISYNIDVSNDDTTEGSEVLTISINNSQLPIYDNINSVLTTSTTINDTSLDPIIIDSTSLKFNTCLLDMGGVGECGTGLVPNPAVVLGDNPLTDVVDIFENITTYSRTSTSDPTIKILPTGYNDSDVTITLMNANATMAFMAEGVEHYGLRYDNNVITITDYNDFRDVALTLKVDVVAKNGYNASSKVVNLSIVNRKYYLYLPYDKLTTTSVDDNGYFSISEKVWDPGEGENYPHQIQVSNSGISGREFIIEEIEVDYPSYVRGNSVITTNLRDAVFPFVGMYLSTGSGGISGNDVTLVPSATGIDITDEFNTNPQTNFNTFSLDANSSDTSRGFGFLIEGNEPLFFHADNTDAPDDIQYPDSVRMRLTSIVGPNGSTNDVNGIPTDLSEHYSIDLEWTNLNS